MMSNDSTAIAQANTTTPAVRTQWLTALGVVALLAIHTVLAFTAARHHSSVYDEAAFITAGYSYWAFDDYRLHPENGLATQLWVGLPVWLMQPTWPTDDIASAWQRSNVWRIAKVFLYESGNDADSILLAARAMTTLASVGLGWLVFGWAYARFGRLAGLVALSLYALSPTTIAHAGLATGDLLTAMLLLAATGAIWRVLHRIDLLSVVAAGICIPMLAMSKTSWVLLFPITAVLISAKLAVGRTLTIQLLVDRSIPSRLSQGGVIAAATAVVATWTVAVIWAAMGWRYAVSADTGVILYRQWDELYAMVGRLEAPARQLASLQLVPEAFLYGTLHTIAFSNARLAFLCGDYRIHGWWWFFPFAFLVKSTAAELLFASVSLIAGIAAARHRRDTLYVLTPLLALLGVYGLASVTTGLNIGHRHLLPIYPVLYILAGGAAVWLVRRIAAAKVLLMVLVAAAALEATLYWPNHLSYFNASVGGPAHGYRYLVDSSLDWGQDLPALRRWLESEGLNGPIKSAQTPVYLAYFGTAEPDYYGIHAQRIPGGSMLDQGPTPLIDEPLLPGVYCISATYLQSVYTPTFGQWCVPWEAQYQEWRRDFATYRAMLADPAQRERALALDTPRLREAKTRYLHLRLGRLYRYLLQREPDEWAGYSIAIYRVSEEELTAGLEGPPVELYPEP